MAYQMHFGADDLLNCRFALSPSWETQQAVRLLAHPGSGHHLPWLRRSTEAARGLGLERLWLLMPGRGYTPDFLCPPPAGPVTSFEEEMAPVRETDPAIARAEIGRSLAHTPGAADTAEGAAMLADPARAIQRLADAKTRAWEVLVAPHWPRLRALLEADIAFHTRRLADGGLAALFDGLHPSVSWEDRTLTVSHTYTYARTLDGAGLTLIPSMFAWPHVISGFEPPWHPAVVYPARGVGGLWSEDAAGTEGREALARLLGANRAAVLVAVAEPASTTGLAARLGLAPSSVSAHLSALRGAGLLTSYRLHHQVLYERTPLGIALSRGGT